MLGQNVQNFVGFLLLRFTDLWSWGKLPATNLMVQTLQILHLHKKCRELHEATSARKKKKQFSGTTFENEYDLENVLLLQNQLSIILFIT